MVKFFARVRMCDTRYSVTIAAMDDDMGHAYCAHFEDEPDVTS